MTGRSRIAAGIGLPGVVILLGLLAIWERSMLAAGDALRQFGVLLSLVSGIFSAVWWHQSADLARRSPYHAPARDDADMLNAAAATSTALALIASVFTNVSPWSSSGVVAAGSFLLLLGMSGSEVAGAAALCVRQPLRPRVVLGLLILLFATAVFVFKNLPFEPGLPGGVGTKPTM